MASGSSAEAFDGAVDQRKHVLLVRANAPQGLAEEVAVVRRLHRATARHADTRSA
jgi:hypothetical protein